MSIQPETLFQFLILPFAVFWLYCAYRFFQFYRLILQHGRPEHSWSDIRRNLAWYAERYPEIRRYMEFQKRVVIGVMVFAVGFLGIGGIVAILVSQGFLQ